MTDSTIKWLIKPVRKLSCNQCGAAMNLVDAEPFTSVSCSACGASLTVPGLLGSFVLFKVMGEGAMGAVYQGFDQTLKRHVAIKVIRKTLGDDPEFVEKFLCEARTLAALNHSHVVQVYSCGQEKGHPYMIMELVNGAKLDSVMEGGEQVDEAALLEIAEDVVLGLKAAWEIGLIHGDIKPGNILLDKNGTAKVVDFGLARAAADQQGLSEVWGTPFRICTV